jgi:hypothetical protein
MTRRGQTTSPRIARRGKKGSGVCNCARAGQAPKIVSHVLDTEAVPGWSRSRRRLRGRCGVRAAGADYPRDLSLVIGGVVASVIEPLFWADSFSWCAPAIHAVVEFGNDPPSCLGSIVGCRTTDLSADPIKLDRSNSGIYTRIVSVGNA